MSNTEQLSKILTDISRRRGQGRLYVFCGNYSARPAEIDVNQGKVAAIWHGSASGQEAFLQMLNQGVHKVLFVESQEPYPVSADDMPTIAALLALIEDAGQRLSSDMLVGVLDEAETILSDVLGKRAHAKIAALALQHPPAEQPLRFVESCEQAMADVCGAKVSQRAFKKMHDRVEQLQAA